MRTKARLLVGVFLIALFNACTHPIPNPQWELFESPAQSHWRGLDVINDNVVWLSGSDGRYARTTDGGKTWNTGVLPNSDSLQFRDIEAFNKNAAIVVSAGSPGRIYRTDDGGDTWNLQFEDTTPEIFLDGIDFWDEQNGICYGDPISGFWTILKTTNGGETWIRLDSTQVPPAPDGAGSYAASGTGIVLLDGGIGWIATGGPNASQVLRTNDYGESWSVTETPMRLGQGAGIFSIAFAGPQVGVAVGGDYVDSTSIEKNCARTTNGGKTWKLVSRSPNGYRSCVAVHPKYKIWVAVGRTGAEFSGDVGDTWSYLSKEAFYSCKFSDDYLWASGRNGKVAKMLVRDLVLNSEQLPFAQ